MKRTFLFLFLLASMTLKVSGQNHLLGVRGGVAWTSIRDFYGIDNSYRVGFNGGFSYDYVFKNGFSVGADVVYSQRGTTHNIPMITDITGKPLGAGTSHWDFDYLSIPVKAGFTYGNTVYGFVNMGVTPSLLVLERGTLFRIENEEISPERFKIEDSQSKKFDIGGLAEIGGGYRLGSKYWLFTSFSYHHSFTKIRKDSPYKVRHWGMVASLGLKYQL